LPVVGVDVVTCDVVVGAVDAFDGPPLEHAATSASIAASGTSRRRPIGRS
jgi:hypothetical protein